VFYFGCVPLKRTETFKYLGTVFSKTPNMAKSAAHMLGLFMAGCRRFIQFAHDSNITNMALLSKASTISA